MKMIVSAIMMIVLISCSENNNKKHLAVNKIDTVWLNRVIKKSDTVYTKPYKRTDFVTAIFLCKQKRLHCMSGNEGLCNAYKTVAYFNKEYPYSF